MNMSNLTEIHEANNPEFLVGDVVVLTKPETKDELLEIIETSFVDGLYRVKIISSGSCGPIFKDDIRQATPAELHARKRLPRDLNKHLESALTAKGEVA